MKAKQLLRHAMGDQAGYVAIFSGVRDPTANRLQYREQCFFECPEDLGRQRPTPKTDLVRGCETSTSQPTRSQAKE